MRLLARHAMTYPVFSTNADTDLPTLEQELVARGIGGAPVVNETGAVIGMVSKTDVVRQLRLNRVLSGVIVDYLQRTGTLRSTAASRSETTGQLEIRAFGHALGGRLQRDKVADCMVTPAQCVSANTPLSEVAELLVERGIHRVPVLRDGKLVGIVTTLDVLEAMQRRRRSRGATKMVAPAEAVRTPAEASAAFQSPGSSITGGQLARPAKPPPR